MATATSFPAQRAWLLILTMAFGLAIFRLAGVPFPDWTMSPDGRVVGHELLQIVLAAVALIFVLRWEGRPAPGLGLCAPRLGTVGWGVLGAVAVLISGGIVAALGDRVGLHVSTEMLSRLADRPVGVVLLIAITAAVSEEIVFRSILIDHLTALTGRTWVGIAGSIVAFAAMHAYAWGVFQILVTTLPGVVLTALMVRRRDLSACVLAHFLTDAIGLLSYGASHHG